MAMSLMAALIGAAEDGPRGGWEWEDAGVFGVEFGGREQIWPTWWSSGVGAFSS